MSKRWHPSPAQLVWTKNLIDSVSDNAMWGAPAMGVFRFDKPRKKLYLVEKYPSCDEELLARTKIAFELCGYKLVDATPGGGKGRWN